jgi:hypothetical protein
MYKIAADTLLYKSGDTYRFSLFEKKCLNCDKRLTRLYQHKNPKYGKQKWLSVGWYCDRCKYGWLDFPS